MFGSNVLLSAICLFTNVAVITCLCNITYNSTDVVVNCYYNNTDTSNVPKNVTVLNCCFNNYFCNESLFCNRSYEKLRVINISNNDIKYIPKGCFSSFTDLENLKISNNVHLSFDNVYNAFYGLDKTKVKQIFASNINRVMVIYPFPRNISILLTNTSLQIFDIAYNEIQTVESGALFYLPRTLRDLSIRGNRLEGDDVFLEFANLSMLQKLDVSYQCSIRKYSYRTRRRAVLERGYVDKTDNDCKDRRLENLFRVVPSSLKTLIATAVTSLSSCIPRLSISNQSQLEYVDISWSEFHNWIGPIIVHPMFNNIKVLNLSHNQCNFIKNGFFNNLTQVRNLDISYNLLGPYLASNKAINVFQGLKSLKLLRMTSNFINHLDKNLLKDNILLEELYINLNGLEAWTLDISHLNFLTLIDCSLNKLATLPKPVRDRLDTTSQNKTVKVNFSENKILCSCENLDFLDWLFTSKVIVNISETEECTGIKGQIKYGYQYLKEECVKDHKEWLYPVQTICLLFILSVIAVVVYKKRWALIYRWYLFRLRRKQYTPIEECDDGYQFDAFLSFADENRAFVDRVLEELEGNPELKLNVCVHFRDFIPGKSISRNIVSSIHSSKKTIVFMSRAYLKSDWCKYELRMAITEESHMNREVVIMTVLEDIPQKELSLDVLQYYKKNSYINKPNTEEELNLYWKMLEKLL